MLVRVFLCVDRPAQSHLFWLLRPELVQHWPEPLSSDSFCFFGAYDPQFKQLNARVNRCTRALLLQVGGVEEAADASMWARMPRTRTALR